MRTRAFGADEPCHPDDIHSPCYDWGAPPAEDPQSPGPDVGAGPGVPCVPSSDPTSECYDPLALPEEDPQSPGPDVSDPPIDLTDPKYQSKFPPLSRNWLDDILNGAVKAGGDILDGLGKGDGAGGGGTGSGGGGSRDGAGSGEGEIDNTKLWLLGGAAVLVLSGVLK